MHQKFLLLGIENLKYGQNKFDRDPESFIGYPHMCIYKLLDYLNTNGTT